MFVVLFDLEVQFFKQNAIQIVSGFAKRTHLIASMAAHVLTLLPNVIYGQVIAILLVAQFVCTKYLSARHFVPLAAFQTTLFYVVLSFVCVLYLCVTKKARSDRPFWFWLVLGIVDVEGNYCTIKAVAHDTNYAMLGLVLHMTVPFVSILSYLFLRKRYSLAQFGGCTLATCGTILVIIISSSEVFPPVQTDGNLWALAAALLFSISNVMQEYAVKMTDQTKDAAMECLGNMGIVGSVVALIQMTFLGDFHQLNQVLWTKSTCGYLAGYIAAAVLFYVVASVVLRVTQSMAFNLSLLMSDVYSAMTVIWFFGDALPSVYWIIWAIQLVGIGIFSSHEPIQLPMRRKPGWRNDSEISIHHPSTPVVTLSLPRHDRRYPYDAPELSNISDDGCTMEVLESNYVLDTTDYLYAMEDADALSAERGNNVQ
ncbi:unnamed protein product [Aphanomyces euteiches]